MELEGKAAIVTGGAVRLGRAMVLALAEKGVRVAIHYHSSAAAAEETSRQVEALGSGAVTLQADLSQPDEARKLLEQAVAHFGRVDVLVNNAAIFEGGGWDETTQDDWDRHFAINLKAPFFLGQAFARHVGGERRGHIVNIADWRGARPGSDHLAYTLTKAGLIALTKSLALALAPGIQVNAIAPGAILPPAGGGGGYPDSLASRIPAGRTGSPGDVGKTLIYLLESDFVTGEVILVTGGEHL
jgi:pteridine reductase